MRGRCMVVVALLSAVGCDGGGGGPSDVDSGLRGDAGVDEVAAAFGNTPRHGNQGRLRLRCERIDKKVVLVRRWAWRGFGQGGFTCLLHGPCVA